MSASRLRAARGRWRWRSRPRRAPSGASRATSSRARSARTASCRAATAGSARRRSMGSSGWIGASDAIVEELTAAASGALAPHRARRAEAAGLRGARGRSGRGAGRATAQAARAREPIDLARRRRRRRGAGRAARARSRGGAAVVPDLAAGDVRRATTAQDEALALAEAMNRRAPLADPREHGAHRTRDALIGAAGRRARGGAADGAVAGGARRSRRA